LKGEYIAGKHPTQGGSDDYYSNSSITSTSLNYYPLASGVYERNFAGGYVYLVQNIDPIGCQFVLKYDYFDPNTKVTGSDFVNTSAVAAVGTTPAIPAVKTTLTSADIAYTTWGVGLIYYVKWDPNVRLQLYYEMPKNEKLDAAKVTTGSLVAYTKAVNKNMLTFRVQYKF
jgi:hypothetical protein